MKHAYKGHPPVKKDVAAAISNSLRIMSYKPERTDEDKTDEAIDNRKSVLKGQNLNKKGIGQKALISTNQPRYDLNFLYQQFYIISFLLKVIR